MTKQGQVEKADTPGDMDSDADANTNGNARLQSQDWVLDSIKIPISALCSVGQKLIHSLKLLA